MEQFGIWLTKYRNAFLIGVLAVTLAISGYANQQRVSAAATTVSIPVMETDAIALSPLEACRQQRDQEALRDLSALEALINQPLLDEATRESAADRLEELVSSRQAQSAMESALSGSSLHPCVAVIHGGSVTIVTDKAAVTDKDSALVLTLAAAHTGTAPENVRIITAEQ